jgi:hypothetical protein
MACAAKRLCLRTETERPCVAAAIDAVDRLSRQKSKNVQKKPESSSWGSVLPFIPYIIDGNCEERNTALAIAAVAERLLYDATISLYLPSAMHHGKELITNFYNRGTCSAEGVGDHVLSETRGDEAALSEERLKILDVMDVNTAAWYSEEHLSRFASDFHSSLADYMLEIQTVPWASDASRACNVALQLRAMTRKDPTLISQVLPKLLPEQGGGNGRSLPLSEASREGAGPLAAESAVPDTSHVVLDDMIVAWKHWQRCVHRNRGERSVPKGNGCALNLIGSNALPEISYLQPKKMLEGCSKLEFVEQAQKQLRTMLAHVDAQQPAVQLCAARCQTYYMVPNYREKMLAYMESGGSVHSPFARSFTAHMDHVCQIAATGAAATGAGIKLAHAELAKQEAAAPPVYATDDFACWVRYRPAVRMHDSDCYDLFVQMVMADVHAAAEHDKEVEIVSMWAEKVPVVRNLPKDNTFVPRFRSVVYDGLMRAAWDAATPKLGREDYDAPPAAETTAAAAAAASHRENKRCELLCLAITWMRTPPDARALLVANGEEVNWWAVRLNLHERAAWGSRGDRYFSDDLTSELYDAAPDLSNTSSAKAWVDFVSCLGLAEAAHEQVVRTIHRRVVPFGILQRPYVRESEPAVCMWGPIGGLAKHELMMEQLEFLARRACFEVPKSMQYSEQPQGTQLSAVRSAQWQLPADDDGGDAFRTWLPSLMPGYVHARECANKRRLALRDAYTRARKLQRIGVSRRAAVARFRCQWQITFEPPPALPSLHHPSGEVQYKLPTKLEQLLDNEDCVDSRIDEIFKAIAMCRAFEGQCQEGREAEAEAEAEEEKEEEDGEGELDASDEGDAGRSARSTALPPTLYPRDAVNLSAALQEVDRYTYDSPLRPDAATLLDVEGMPGGRREISGLFTSAQRWMHRHIPYERSFGDRRRDGRDSCRRCCDSDLHKRQYAQILDFYEASTLETLSRLVQPYVWKQPHIRNVLRDAPPVRLVIRKLRVNGALMHAVQQGADLGREESQPCFLSKDAQWIEYGAVRKADEATRELVRTEAIYEMLHQSYWPRFGLGLAVEWTATVSLADDSAEQSAEGEDVKPLARVTGLGVVSRGAYVPAGMG